MQRRDVRWDRGAGDSDVAANVGGGSFVASRSSAGRTPCDEGRGPAAGSFVGGLRLRAFAPPGAAVLLTAVPPVTVQHRRSPSFGAHHAPEARRGDAATGSQPQRRSRLATAAPRAEAMHAEKALRYCSFSALQ